MPRATLTQLANWSAGCVDAPNPLGVGKKRKASSTSDTTPTKKAKKSSNKKTTAAAAKKGAKGKKTPASANKKATPKKKGTKARKPLTAAALKGVKLKMWDAKLKQGRIVILAAKRGSGKSVAGEHLILRNRHQWAVPIGFSHVPESRATLEQYFPSFLVHKHYDLKFVDQLMKFIQDWQEKFMGTVPKDELELMLPEVLLYIDDCNENDGVWRTKTIKKMFQQGRHYRMAVLYMIQSIGPVPKSIKQNTDFVILFREMNGDVVKAIHNEFLRPFIPSPTEFQKIFNKLTDDRHVLVIDITSTSNNPEDYIFRWKADPEYIKKHHARGTKVGHWTLWMIDHIVKRRAKFRISAKQIADPDQLLDLMANVGEDGEMPDDTPDGEDGGEQEPPSLSGKGCRVVLSTKRGEEPQLHPLEEEEEDDEKDEENEKEEDDDKDEDEDEQDEDTTTKRTTRTHRSQKTQKSKRPTRRGRSSHHGMADGLSRMLA
jgi:hypothetical protein